MCRKSILFVLVFLVFTYVLSKEVKSQAPLKPTAVPPPILIAQENATVQVPAKPVSLSPPLLVGQETDADRPEVPGKGARVEPTLKLPPEAPKDLQAPVPAPPPAVVAASVAPRKSVNIWSIQIEQEGGKNIVRATIGKKSAVRIVCDQVDLHTPTDMFQAQGNVELAGEGMHGRCERLTINLIEDRLILDGKAEVGIYNQQRSKDAPDGPAASQKSLLELKGELLSLRWPYLEIKTDAPPAPSPAGENVPPRIVVPPVPNPNVPPD